MLGNILPVPVLILFARRVLFFLAKQPKIGKYFQKIIDIGQSKIDKLGNYEYLGLYLFVAVPMPGTAAWTGSLSPPCSRCGCGRRFWSSPLE